MAIKHIIASGKGTYWRPYALPAFTAHSIGSREVHHVYFAPNAPRTPFRFSFSAAPTANS